MKYLMTIVAIIMATNAFGQTNSVYAKKIRARDEIQLGPNEVTQFEQDTSLASISNGALPTSYAVYWFVLNRLNAGVDTVFTIGNDFYLVAGQDTFVAALPQIGSGTANMVAVWETDSTLTSRAWEVTDSYIKGVSTGWPQIENAFYTFVGDSNTGLKRGGPDILGLHVGDAVNPMVTLDGPGEWFRVDADDNGTSEFAINAIKIWMYKIPRFLAFSSASSTHLLGVDGSNELTKIAAAGGLKLVEGATIDTARVDSFTVDIQSLCLPWGSYQHLGSYLDTISAGQTKVVRLNSGIGEGYQLNFTTYEAEVLDTVLYYAAIKGLVSLKATASHDLSVTVYWQGAEQPGSTSSATVGNSYVTIPVQWTQLEQSAFGTGWSLRIKNNSGTTQYYTISNASLEVSYRSGICSGGGN